MAPGDRLEVVDKCIVDRSTAEGADDWDGLGGRLLGNDQPEPRGNLSDQPNEDWAAFLNDPSLSDEPRCFGDRLREDPTDDEIIALRRIVGLRPSAEAKDLNA